MKNKLMLAVVVLLLVAGGYAVWHAHSQDVVADQEVANATTSSKPNAACKAFTLSDAKKLLGASTIATPPAPSVSSSAISTSNCVYSNGSSDVNTIQTASILIRTPKNTVGTKNNQSQFNPQPSGTQTVTGYGQSAFWSAQYGQLNVLKNNKWVILSIGPPSPDQHTLTQTKQLADLVIPNL